MYLIFILIEEMKGGYKLFFLPHQMQTIFLM